MEKVTHKFYTAELICHEDHIGRQLKKGRFYESEMLAFIEELLEKIPRGGIIDAGANIGNHSIFFGAFTDHWVYAFEPSHDNFEILCKNIAGNEKNNPIIAFNKALGDECKMVSIDKTEGNRGMDSVVEGDTVEMVTLDGFMLDKTEKCVLIKIDTEGYESKVLRGGLKLIERDSPYIFAEAKTKEERTDIDKILIPLGYRRSIKPFNATPTYFYFKA